MLLSILHRITGVALSCGLVVLVLWLLLVASGPEQYQYFRVMMSTPVGIALLIGWTFAFLLHLANGVRHLVWDSGRGFEIRHANASAWAALVGAAMLTTLIWGLQL